MRVAFVIPARNKIHGVRGAVDSVLSQNYSPMELIFSDQGSTDGTREQIAKHIASYDGPNKARLLDCPLTQGRPGMGALNAHVDWIMGQTDADVIILGSSDDVSHPDRATKVMRGFEETGAAMVNTAIKFMSTDGRSFTTDFPEETRFVTGSECLDRLVGGSSSPAWTHEFYDRIGGVPGLICSDVYMPYLATLDKGLYYINEALYFLIRWPDKKNTGIGGRQLAQEGEEETLKLREIVQFQLNSTFKQIAKCCDEKYPNFDHDKQQKLYSYILGTAVHWSEIRDEMAAKSIVQDMFP